MICAIRSDKTKTGYISAEKKAKKTIRSTKDTMTFMDGQ